jgi:hypothetical protein
MRNEIFVLLLYNITIVVISKQSAGNKQINYKPK